MSSGGGGSGTTSTKPWYEAQPYYKDLYQQAQNWVDQGGQSFYPGQTYADLAPQQQQALQQKTDLATATLPGQIGNVQSPYFDLLNGSGYTAAGNAVLPGSVNAINDAAQGGAPAYNAPQIGFTPSGANIMPDLFNPNVDSIAGPSPNDSLSQMMSATPDMSVWQPAMDAAVRPLFQDYNRFTANNIRDQAIAAGQQGGSRQGVAEGIAMGDVLNKAGDIRSQMALQAARDALQQRSQGTGIAANLQQAQGQLGLGQAQLAGNLATSQAGLDQGTQQMLAGLATNQAGLGLDTLRLNEGSRQAGIQQQLAAAGLGTDLAGSAYGQQLNTLGMAPQMLSLSTLPSTMLGQVGDVYQAQDQQAIDEAMSRYNMENNQMGQLLPWYSNILTGNPSLTTTTSSAPRPNQQLTALGGAATGASIGGTVGGPYGAAIGAGIGGLYGYFG